MNKTLFWMVIMMSFTLSSRGQVNYPFEAGIKSDNDAYLFLALDQYYTNGFELYLRFVPKKYNENLANKIIEVSAGQKIYNPFQGYVPWVERMDKPFAGYLFFEAGVSRFYKNESMLRTALQLGVLGPSSHAEEVQIFYHRAFNLYSLEGWEYQVHDALGVNMEVSYLKYLKSFFNRQLDFSFSAGARAGTIHNEISAGFLTRASIYRLKPLYSSQITGSSINRNKDADNGKELFLHFRPTLSYIVYDATIQGGMFSDCSPVTYGVRPFRLLLEMGISGSYKNYIAGYSVIFQTKDAKNSLVRCHVYASISLAYRFNI